MAKPYSDKDRDAFLYHEYSGSQFRYLHVIPPDISSGDLAEGGTYANHAVALETLENIISKEPLADQQMRMEQLLKSYSDTPGLTRELFFDVYVPAARQEVALKNALMEKGEAAFSNVIARAGKRHNDIALREVAVDTPEMHQAFKQLYYPNENGKGLGVEMGHYGVAHSAGGKATNDFLATDFLMDCISVTLYGTNPNKPDERVAALAHVDFTTDPKAAIEKMLDEIPKGYTIQANVFGSTISQNPYTNAGIMHELLESGRVSSIGYNFHGPSTVAIHTPTGTVLTSDKKESEGSSSSIDGELPADIAFIKSPSARIDQRDANWSYVMGSQKAGTHFPASSPLLRAVHPTKPLEAELSIAEGLELRMLDGNLTTKEMNKTAKEIGRQLDIKGVSIDVVYPGVLQIFADEASLGQVFYDEEAVKVEAPSQSAAAPHTPAKPRDTNSQER